MVNRFLVFVGVLVPFLMSAFCVFSVVYLFPGIAAEFHVSIKYLSFLVMLSFIGGALVVLFWVCLLMRMVGVLACWCQY
ncbi:MAG: hypothetical protein ACP5GZ_08985 [Vulcanisaeta sp.]|uniref:hypothetical protein n=1 Tax=Vulcanisaeta sp. TaxID=2020871 RepID=UPI003D103157